MINILEQLKFYIRKIKTTLLGKQISQRNHMFFKLHEFKTKQSKQI